MDLSFVGAAFWAVEKGAASVYHHVLATGAEITAWEESNPVVGPLIASGLGYATNLLTRFGIPVETIELVGADIIAGLRHLAAVDATVPSLPVAIPASSIIVSGVTIAENLATIVAPAAEPIIAAAAAIAEGLAPAPAATSG